jgi:hypothetical protein
MFIYETNIVIIFNIKKKSCFFLIYSNLMIGVAVNHRV